MYLDGAIRAGERAVNEIYNRKIEIKHPSKGYTWMNKDIPFYYLYDFIY